MRKALSLFTLMAVLFLAACGSENNNNGAANEEEVEDEIWAEIQESGELVVGTAGTLFPASYYPADSDELTGYNVEVFREIADRLGVDIKFEEMAFDAMLSALQSGRVDMIQAGPREDSREKFAFSEPVKYSYSTMIVRSDDLSGIETLEDLKGKKAGGAATTVYSEIARAFGAEVVTYGNVTNDAYLRDVHNGRTDLVINDYYLQSLALTAITEFDITLHPDLKFHPTTNNVVTKKEATVLMEKVNEIIAEMKEDGTLTEISEEFFGGQDVSKEPEGEIIEVEGIE
ncbi:transporter substrate-binding domain-containing protein [Ornithinibacillus halophilus]|uniref:Amino acid ABC transporter substrate-binding protein, PAAT family n=1 Tax=Ornithinibacillus halophilus TaxID=930117 RepID=A0A1M5MHL2_9BACI|nr:transporter substrate-binding domain-containing protein [Ornithinibacillus halophilus]SHG76736.1 amino acid ABC transporter substrate-binding protein, PAAT family [Ornithinibacillus halophilus]